MLTPTPTYKGASGVNRAVLAPASLEAGKRVGDREEAGMPSLLNPACWARDGVLVAARGRNCWESGCFQDCLVFKGISEMDKGPFTLCPAVATPLQVLSQEWCSPSFILHPDRVGTALTALRAPNVRCSHPELPSPPGSWSSSVRALKPFFFLRDPEEVGPEQASPPLP